MNRIKWFLLSLVIVLGLLALKRYVLPPGWWNLFLHAFLGYNVGGWANRMSKREEER